MKEQRIKKLLEPEVSSNIIKSEKSSNKHALMRFIVLDMENKSIDLNNLEDNYELEK